MYIWLEKLSQTTDVNNALKTMFELDLPGISGLTEDLFVGFEVT